MARIIVADDESAIRHLLVTALQRQGHEVDEAVDGKMAVELFRQEPCDLLITDIYMPNGDGLEAIAALRREAPDLKIIAISGGGSREGKDYFTAARRFGAARTLAKPLDMTKLLETVRELLER